MKLCIFSDIHGNNYAFKEFVNQIKYKYDYYLFAGDIYGYYYGVDEVINLMKELVPLKMVIGNHDANYIKLYQSRNKIEYIKKYGKSYTIKSNQLYKLLVKESDLVELNLDGIKIAMVHGTLDDHLNGRDYPDKEKLYCSDYNKFDIVIQGHTHFKMQKKHGKTVIINPGSIGQSRNSDGVTYAIYDTQKKEVLFNKIFWNKQELYKEIALIEPENKKIIEVLEREKER